MPIRAQPGPAKYCEGATSGAILMIFTASRKDHWIAFSSFCGTFNEVTSLSLIYKNEMIKADEVYGTFQL